MMAIMLQAYGTILNLEVMVDNSLFLVFVLKHSLSTSNYDEGGLQQMTLEQQFRMIKKNLYIDV